MQVLQTTLLTGPYDWDPALLPKAEFETRLERVRGAMAAAHADALLVHGIPGEYGALAYLTNFVPKLGLAIALVPREDEIRLIVSGTALMLTQAKLLTWVDDLKPAADVPKLVAGWLAEKRAERLALWGARGMAHGLHRGIAQSIQTSAEPVVLDDALDKVRRRKSARELDLMRASSRILARASSAFVAAAQGGAGARTASLAFERAAIAAGAQDARTLASLHPGGPPLPLDGPEDRIVDPLLAVLAVQYAGYWAEGLVTVAARPGDGAAKTRAALAAMLREAKPGASGAALHRASASALGGLAPSPYLGAVPGSAIGLSLEEGSLAGDAALEEGATYVLRAGTSDALASALVAIGPSGPDVLWQTP
jgi:Xaa-Pro aminopeptidase